MSIVLVIIGLIAGGILVGQNLIAAANVSATVSQIQRYQTAANTFRDKYGSLPGDLKAADAQQFGFVNRLGVPGAGDGNGVIDGLAFNTQTIYDWYQDGETLLFWVDLSTAHMIDGTFNTAKGTTDTPYVSLTTSPSLDAYLPQAKIRSGAYFYVFANSNTAGVGGSSNYFGIASISQISNGYPYSGNVLTATEAAAIDNKIDDGLPQSGNVTAAIANVSGIYWWQGYSDWASWPGINNAQAVAGSATSCFDNSSTPSGTPGVAWAQRHYSVEMGSSGLNCPLAFKIK